jgi:hypothetical protein
MDSLITFDETAEFLKNSITAANTVHESVINTINQLIANQAALVQHMAAMLLTNHNRTPPAALIKVPVPPRQQITIPTQAYLNAGWDPSTKGMHKTKSPGFLQCGAECKVATKLNHSVDVYANTPYPTQIINATTEVNDDDKTIVTSN